MELIFSQYNASHATQKQLYSAVCELEFQRMNSLSMMFGATTTNGSYGPDYARDMFDLAIIPNTRGASHV